MIDLCSGAVDDQKHTDIILMCILRSKHLKATWYEASREDKRWLRSSVPHTLGYLGTILMLVRYCLMRKIRRHLGSCDWWSQESAKTPLTRLMHVNITVP